MQRTIYDMTADTDVSHYICRILANLLNSGGSYLIVYQSYFSQVLNGLPYKNACCVVMQVDRDFYYPRYYFFNHIKFSHISFGCKGEQNLSLVPQLICVCFLYKRINDRVTHTTMRTQLMLDFRVFSYSVSSSDG